MLQEYVSFVFSVKEIKNMLWSNIKNSQERKPRTTGFIEGIYSLWLQEISSRHEKKVNLRKWNDISSTVVWWNYDKRW